MVKTNKKPRKKAARRKAATKGRAAGKKKTSARRAPARRNSPARRKTTKLRRRGGSGTAKKKTTAKKKIRKPSSSPRRVRGASESEFYRGPGPESGGQSGDVQGLSRTELADSESVEELVEEGQAFEAGVVSGVENAPDADESEVKTREVPEDDVPQEYLDED
jgi:hypothetical protein